MRLSFLLLALAACVTAAPYHSCPAPCGSGQSCDTAIGERHVDPCEGRCARGERCDLGPPAQCIILPISEMDISRPDNSPNAGQLH
jgi:hypothetical protein